MGDTVGKTNTISIHIFRLPFPLATEQDNTDNLYYSIYSNRSAFPANEIKISRIIILVERVFLRLLLQKILSIQIQGYLNPIHRYNATRKSGPICHAICNKHLFSLFFRDNTYHFAYIHTLIIPHYIACSNWQAFGIINSFCIELFLFYIIKGLRHQRD